MECSFKTNLFAEFDLNDLTKTDNLPYSTSDDTFEREFQFTFCEPITTCDDEDDESNCLPVQARMKILPDGEFIDFGEPVSKQAYTAAYGPRALGSRGTGSVYGLLLTYESSDICDAATEET